MPMVKHGRMDLRWCDRCSVPLMARGPCPSCGGSTRSVTYTPPGDVRPAFPFDVQAVRRLAEGQWGGGAGMSLFPDEGPYLLNPCPSPDRMDEVIVDGSVIASASFVPANFRTTLILRSGGLARLRSKGHLPERGFVKADAVAVEAVLGGKSLLSPGITEAHHDIRSGDEVLVLDQNGSVIGSGTARKGGPDLVGTRGMGVKVRWVVDRTDTSAPHPSPFSGIPFSKIWEDVSKANRPHLDGIVEKALSFVKEMVAQSDLPVAVSFSGGKDSLATLLLVMDAGIRPKVMFVDTGIEFPETVEHVMSFVPSKGLELIVGRPNSSFFDDIHRFGPPGRDFRWCCKSLKLGPANTLIERHFPSGVLAFIGQRRFESDIRERKGRTWKNPWVPKQLSASPVQDWTALDVWLYIFTKGEPYNPLYERGFNRIGCWLCPSSDLSELELVGSTSADIGRFRSALEEERRKRGLPEEWIKYGFHRFKKVPPHMLRLRDELGLPEMEPGDGLSERPSDLPPVEYVSGYGSCMDGLSQEGRVNMEIDMGRLSCFLSVIGAVKAIDGANGLEVVPGGWGMKRPAIEVYDDGTLLVRGVDADVIRDLERKFLSVLKRHMGCVGCGICLGRCERHAISLGPDLKAVVDAGRCVHCGSCLGPCPSEAYESDPF